MPVLDICYERSKENHHALAAALRDLSATLRGAPAGLPFILDDRTFAMGDSFTFDTVDGLGTGPEHPTEVELDEGLRVAVCSLDDLMRMKRAGSRGYHAAHVA